MAKPERSKDEAVAGVPSSAPAVHAIAVVGPMPGALGNEVVHLLLPADVVAKYAVARKPRDIKPVVAAHILEWLEGVK